MFTPTQKPGEETSLRNPFTKTDEVKPGMCKYYTEVNLHQILSIGSSSASVFFDSGKEGIYTVDFYLNVVSILPVTGDRQESNTSTPRAHP